MSDQLYHTQVWPLRDRLFRLALAQLGDRAEAQDAVQETLIRLWEQRCQLPEIRSIEGWCIRALRNHGIDRLRARKRRPRLPLDTLPQPPMQAPQAIRQLQNQEIRQRIDQLIQALPQQRRLVLLLRETEGLSYQQIADQLGISLDQVRTDLHRARQSLRRSLVKNPCHE